MQLAVALDQRPLGEDEQRRAVAVDELPDGDAVDLSRIGRIAWMRANLFIIPSSWRTISGRFVGQAAHGETSSGDRWSSPKLAMCWKSSKDAMWSIEMRVNIVPTR